MFRLVFGSILAENEVKDGIHNHGLSWLSHELETYGQSFPGERSSIKFSVAHHTSQEVNDDNEASTSAVCIRETKYNWTSRRFVTTSAQADCQIWLSSCKHLNVRLQLQNFSQLYTPHLWKSDHEAVVREIKHVALRSGWDMARSLHLTWTAACANTTTAAGSQWFQWWKHGNQVYLGFVQFNMQFLNWGMEKKHEKKTSSKAGPFTSVYRVPQRHEALALYPKQRSDSLPGSGSSPEPPRGSGASNDIKFVLMQSKWLEDVFILYRYVPISSRHWYLWNYVTVVFMVFHGVLGRLSFRSTGQSEHNGPFASPGLAN